LILL
jgi:hypothetical protein